MKAEIGMVGSSFCTCIIRYDLNMFPVFGKLIFCNKASQSWWLPELSISPFFFFELVAKTLSWNYTVVSRCNSKSSVKTTSKSMVEAVFYFNHLHFLYILCFIFCFMQLAPSSRQVQIFYLFQLQFYFSSAHIKDVSVKTQTEKLMKTFMPL